MNLAYKTQVKEELDKMLDTKYIYIVENSEWVILIIFIKKNNGKL